MTIETSYAEAREHLDRLLQRASEDRETIIVTGPHGERVAMVAADELEGYQETEYLMRSPANARRLLEALRQSLDGETELVDLLELRVRLMGADDSAGTP